MTNRIFKTLALPLAVLAFALVAPLSLASATPAQAAASSLAPSSHAAAAAPLVRFEAPLNLSGSNIYDPANVLGQGITRIETQIEGLIQRNAQFHVAIIDSYGDLRPEEWNVQTMKESNFGPQTYLLSVSVAEEKYFASASEGSSLTASQVESIASQYAEPQFSSGDIVAGIEAFGAELTNYANSGWGANSSSPTEVSTASTNFTTIAVVVLLLALIGAVVLGLVFFRRGGKSAPSSQTEAGTEGATAAGDGSATAVESGEATKADPAAAAGAGMASPVTATQPEGNAAAQPGLAGGAAEGTAAGGEVAGKMANAAAPADSTSAVKALLEADNALLAAREDLAVSQAQFGQETTANFVTELQRAQGLQWEAFNTAAQAQDEQAWGQVAALSGAIKTSLKAHVDAFARLRHRPSTIESTFQALSQRAGESQQLLDQAGATLAQLHQNYPATSLSLTDADMAAARKLLASGKQGLAAGQAKAGEGDRATAVRYSRGSERAFTQVIFTAQQVNELQGLLANLQAMIQNLQGLLPAGPAQQAAAAALSGQADLEDAFAQVLAALPAPQVSAELAGQLAQLLIQQAGQLRAHISLRRKTLPLAPRQDFASLEQAAQRALAAAPSDPAGAIGALQQAGFLLGGLLGALRA